MLHDIHMLQLNICVPCFTQGYVPSPALGVRAAQGAGGDDADAGVDLARLCATFGADPFITAFAQSLGELPARSPGGAGATLTLYPALDLALGLTALCMPWLSSPRARPAGRHPRSWVASLVLRHVLDFIHVTGTCRMAGRDCQARPCARPGVDVCAALASRSQLSCLCTFGKLAGVQAGQVSATCPGVLALRPCQWVLVVCTCQYVQSSSHSVLSRGLYAWDVLRRRERAVAGACVGARRSGHGLSGLLPQRAL